MRFSPKKEHMGLRPVTHGGLDYRDLLKRGIRPEEILDFSASVNPFPPAPEVVRAAGSADFTRYPDGESTLLRREIARRLSIHEKNVLVTAGVSEALSLIGLAFVSPGSRCMILGPTYGEYAGVCRLYGGRVEEHRAGEEDFFRPDPEGLRRDFERFEPDLFFLCNPNNPTGLLLDADELGSILDLARSGSAGVILDEAYGSFSGEDGLPRIAEGLIESGDVIILRSMTKDYNLPGARLGYVVAAEAVIECLRRVRAPWSVNAFAQTAGLAALTAEPYYRETWAALRRLSSGLKADLEKAAREFGGRALVRGGANFLLVKVDRKRELIEFLADRRILVRDCESFGLPDYIRIGVRTEGENARLTGALADFWREGGHG